MPLPLCLLLMAASATLLPPPAAAPFAARSDDNLLAFAAEQGSPTTLAEIVQRAVDDSPRTGEASARTLQSRGLVKESKAALYPRIDLDINGQRVVSRAFDNDPQNVLERSRPARRVDGVITVEQTLVDSGAAINRVRAEKARAEAAGTDVVMASEDTALGAVTAWYELWLARADARLAAALTVRNRDILAMVRTRTRSGAGSQADVARVEASLAAAQARNARADQAAVEADLRYRAVVGEQPPADVRRVVATEAIAVDADGAMTAARTSSAGVIAARLRERGAQNDVQAARADQYPRLIAGLDAGKYDLFDNVRDHDVRARLTIRHRLFGGGSGVARLDQAKARDSEARFRTRQSEDDAVRDAGIAQANFVSLSRQGELLRDAYISSRQSRDAYAEEFRVRRGTLTDLLRVETDLVDAASSYLRVVARGDVAGYTLLRATGRLLPALGVASHRIGRLP